MMRGVGEVRKSIHQSRLAEGLGLGDESSMCVLSIKVPLRKKSGNLFNDLRTMPKAAITIGIIVTFMSHSFFLFSRYLSFFLHSFNFILWSAVTAKSTIFQILF